MHEPGMASPRPQLRMEITGLDRFVDDAAGPTLPAGYRLRTFRAGDEEDWLTLLQSGDFSPWSRERLDLLLANEHVRSPRAGVFFVVDVDDRPVGTASTQLHPGPNGGVLAELGWVVVAPEHRGRGLGLVVCRAVLGGIARLGSNRAFLKTDDFRLAAIQTYLTLGFEPALVDPSHPARWAAIRRSLAAGRPIPYNPGTHHP